MITVYPVWQVTAKRLCAKTMMGGAGNLPKAERQTG